MEDPPDSPPLRSRRLEIDTKHGDRTAQIIGATRGLCRFNDSAESNRALHMLLDILIGWVAGKTATEAGDVMERMGTELTDPEVLRGVLKALARAPQELSGAHLLAMSSSLLRGALSGCSLRKDSARTEAQHVLAAFASLDEQLDALPASRRDAMAQGLFSGLDEARLLHLGRPLLLRAVRRPGYNVESLRCLGRAWVAALPRPLQAAKLQATLERLALAARPDPLRCGAMVQALFDALAGAGMRQADLEPHRLAAANGTDPDADCAAPRESTELTIRLKTPEGEHEDLTLHLRHVPSPPRTEAMVQAFRCVLHIASRYKEGPSIPSSTFHVLLDLVFRPQEPYPQELFPDLFNILVHVLRGPKTPRPHLDALLDRLFDARDNLTIGLGQLLSALGATPASKPLWQAVVERGVAATQRHARLGAAYGTACRWITPLIAQPDGDLGTNAGLRMLFDHLETGYTQPRRMHTQAMLDAAFHCIRDSLPSLGARSMFATLLCNASATMPRGFLMLSLDRMTSALHQEEMESPPLSRMMQETFAPVYLDALRAEQKGQASLAKFVGEIPRDSLSSSASFGVVLQSLFRWPVRDLAQLRRLCACVLDSVGQLAEMHLTRFFLALPPPTPPAQDEQLDALTRVLFNHLGGTTIKRAELERALKHVEQFIASSEHSSLVRPPLARALVDTLGGPSMPPRTLARLAATLMASASLQAGTATLRALCEALGNAQAPEFAIRILRDEIARPAHNDGLQQAVLACVLLLSTNAPERKLATSLRPHETLGLKLARQPLLPLQMSGLRPMQMSTAVVTLLPVSPAVTPATLADHLDALLRDGPYHYRDMRLTALFGKLPTHITPAMVRLARESLVREYETLAPSPGVETKNSGPDEPVRPQLCMLYQVLLAHGLGPDQVPGFVEGEIEALEGSARVDALRDQVEWLQSQPL